MKLSYVRLRSSYVNYGRFHIEQKCLLQNRGEFQYDVLSEIYFQMLIYIMYVRAYQDFLKYKCQSVEYLTINMLAVI